MSTSAVDVDAVSINGDFDEHGGLLPRNLVDSPTRVLRSQLILDLDVTFTKAQAVGSIVYGRRVLAGRFVNLSLVRPGGRALRLLKVPGFDRVWTMYSTSEAAPRAVASDGAPASNVLANRLKLGVGPSVVAPAAAELACEVDQTTSARVPSSSENVVRRAGARVGVTSPTPLTRVG